MRLFLTTIVQTEMFFFLIAHHPGLRALWDEKRSDTHYRNKWVLFLKGIAQNHPISNYGAWMLLPPDLVVSTATCYYLYVNYFLFSFLFLFVLP